MKTIVVPDTEWENVECPICAQKMNRGFLFQKIGAAAMWFPDSRMPPEYKGGISSESEIYPATPCCVIPPPIDDSRSSFYLRAWICLRCCVTLFGFNNEFYDKAEEKLLEDKANESMKLFQSLQAARGGDGTKAKET